MPPTQEQPWRTLIQSIKRGNCILLLGPQVSFDPNDAECTPLTTRLAEYLAGQAPLQDLVVNHTDIAHVAQLFKQQFDRMALEIATEDLYNDYQGLTTEFHRNLAALPFKFCINTAPDDFIVNALREAGKQPVCNHYNFQHARPSGTIEPDVANPYIYNLYGHYSDPDSLVLTEDDMLAFLATIIKNSPELPPIIRSQCVDPSINFLFVGFGFHSWHHRVLLHALNAQSSNQSFAIESPVFFQHPEHKQMAVFYSRQHKLEFKKYSWLEFSAQLRQAYEAVPVAPKANSAPISLKQPAKPKVFLCYASEDRLQVTQLSQQLQDAGIEPWQDQQNLRAGDQWDQLLVKVIKEFVNYVIVVQTPTMNRKLESYFHKEIKIALERQAKFPPKVRFVIPIMLSPCVHLEALEALHVIRLDESNGFAQLTQAISSDWQLRQGDGA